MILKILLIPIVIVAFFAMFMLPIGWCFFIGVSINNLSERLLFNKGKPIKYWIATIAGWYFASLSALFMYTLFYNILMFIGF